VGRLRLKFRENFVRGAAAFFSLGRILQDALVSCSYTLVELNFDFIASLCCSTKVWLRFWKDAKLLLGDAATLQKIKIPQHHHHHQHVVHIIV
jgi:hypothetical protein